MYAYWKKFKRMPWELGLTSEPYPEHIKALYEIDRMVLDADRMYKDVGKEIK